MIKEEVILKSSAVNNDQLRPMIVQKACYYQSEIVILCENRTVNAKSIMGIIALPMKEGLSITLQAEGADEAAAIEGIKELLG